MNCPVCARSLAETLSICPSCGAMKDDSVREELQTKITQGVPLRSQPAVAASTPVVELKPLAPRPAMMASQAAAPALKVQTAELVAPKTSPTLVGFQAKSTSLPEWRLQMQNAVQARKGNSGDLGHTFPTNGGAALKAEPIRVPEPIAVIADLRVANALRRIEESRKTFLEPAVEPKKPMAAKAFPLRPFGVVSPTGTGTSTTQSPAMQKPRLVMPTDTPVVAKRDTNKLPPLGVPVMKKVEPTKIDIYEPVEPRIATSGELSSEFAEIKRIRIKAESDSIVDDETNGYTTEIDDLAPFSMRFGAGLFDLIIGSFATMLILSPVAFSRGDWFTARGGITLVVTWAIVMFIYMTVCVGFFGKTMGMRLFSLELVDAIENEYPSLHQAAISSFLFIISLGFAGVGFVTMFFNDEKRAAHDLVSGTILVREF